MKTEPLQITALTLIDKVLEFERITPEKSEWSLDKQKDNKPRFVRLKQIEVLLKYFVPEIFEKKDIPSYLLKKQSILLTDYSNHRLLEYSIPEIFEKRDITSGLDDLLYGLFILRREAGIYENLFKIMDNVITSYPYYHYYPTKRREWNVFDLIHTYINVISFKKAINKISYWNNGIINMDYQSSYSVIMTKKVRKQIDTKYIDEFLSLVVDPFAKTVTMDELIQNFNYPADDLVEIDFEWM